MSTAGLLGRIAVQQGMITREKLRRATREQGRHPDKRLGELLVDLGYIDEGQLGALLAAQARAAVALDPEVDTICEIGGRTKLPTVVFSAGRPIFTLYSRPVQFRTNIQKIMKL